MCLQNGAVCNFQDLGRDLVKGFSHPLFESGLCHIVEMRPLTIAQFVDDLWSSLGLRLRWGDNDGEHLVHRATLRAVDSLYLFDDGITVDGATED